VVKSLNRPGGNITGIAFQTVELTAKRLGMLRELAPQTTRFAALVDPAYAFTDGLVKDAQGSAAALGLPI
jgi:putative ABC transport system substrate-binding protein